MGAMASQITSLTIVYSTVYSVEDQRKHQSYPSLAFVRVIHWRLVNSPHIGPVTKKMFTFDNVSMTLLMYCIICWLVNIQLPQAGDTINVFSEIRKIKYDETGSKTESFWKKIIWPFYQRLTLIITIIKQWAFSVPYRIYVKNYLHGLRFAVCCLESVKDMLQTYLKDHCTVTSLNSTIATLNTIGQKVA